MKRIHHPAEEESQVTDDRIVRAAVVQAAPVAFDRERTLQKTADLAAEAAALGAGVVLFPEAFVSGYPRGSSFGAVVGSRSAEGREWYRRYWESALDVPGPDTDRLGGIARDHGLVLIIGVIEREGGTLYCSVLFFDQHGHLIGNHRKVMPTASERLIWGFGDGSTLPVLATAAGRVGAAICWENYMPLLRTTLYGKGIEIYCTPTADGRETWIPTVRHIAMEGRCFVLSCNQFARWSDYPADYPPAVGRPTDEVVSPGGSCIVNPLGQLLAGPDREGERILCAELDLHEIVRGKFDFDVTGHYARPDIFRLTVNETPAKPVTHWRDPSGDSGIRTTTTPHQRRDPER